MKKIILSLVMLVSLFVAQGVSAATLNPNAVLEAVGDSWVVQHGAPLYGDTADTLTGTQFTTTDSFSTNGTFAVKFSTFELLNIANFVTYKLYTAANALVATGTVFASPFNGASLLVQNLVAGSYKLITTGNVANATGIWSFHTQAQALATPVPAAVWLFGSAMGLLGVFRRKAVANGLAA